MTDNVITVEVGAAATGASCPLCSQASSRVQSHYRRTVKDLPCSGQAIQVVLRVRRFSCANPSCARKIFAEAFPEFTQAYARRTTRFSDALRVLGFAIGAEVGAFVAPKLGLPSSPDTLLRLMRTTTLPPTAIPRILGVDDFALRRSKTYGTLLVDLERQRTIDELPDRSARQLARWLRTHPGVQVMSRDRSGEYARGARLGAPKALQVADRFHVVRNLASVAERVLSHHRKALKQIHLLLPATSPAPLAVRYLQPDRERIKERKRQARLERYEQVLELSAEGMSMLRIAQRLHLNRKTVAQYLQADTFPELVSRPPRPGILAPYLPYLWARWKDGERNVVGLFRELAARGFTGSRMTVECFLQALRAMEQQGLPVETPATTVEMTPRRAIGLMLRRSGDLTEEKRTALQHLTQLHPHIQGTQAPLEQFLQMLQDRRGEELPPWLAAASHSEMAEWRAFVRKLRQDQVAVQAGLTLKWNNGPLEGHINRLKLLKRSMYGRANFDLLRQRVLYQQRECG